MVSADFETPRSTQCNGKKSNHNDCRFQKFLISKKFTVRNAQIRVPVCVFEGEVDSILKVTTAGHLRLFYILCTNEKSGFLHFFGKVILTWGLLVNRPRPK